MVLYTCFSFFSQKDYLIIEGIPFMKEIKGVCQAQKLSHTCLEQHENEK